MWWSSGCGAQFWRKPYHPYPQWWLNPAMIIGNLVMMHCRSLPSRTAEHRRAPQGTAGHPAPLSVRSDKMERERFQAGNEKLLPVICYPIISLSFSMVCLWHLFSCEPKKVFWLGPDLARRHEACGHGATMQFVWIIEKYRSVELMVLGKAVKSTKIQKGMEVTMNDPDGYCRQFLHGPKLPGYCSPVDTSTTEDQGGIEGTRFLHRFHPFESLTMHAPWPGPCRAAVATQF